MDWREPRRRASEILLEEAIPGPRHRVGILWNSQSVDFESERSDTSLGVI